MTSALQLATHCQMSIIGHTFSPQEQDDSIDRVHQGNPNVFLLCVRFALTQRQLLAQIEAKLDRLQTRHC
jgi:hypothetical protein